jgi:hypothetical protein
MFAWLKRLLFGTSGRSANGSGSWSDSRAQERLDRLFAELEEQSNLLVEDAITNFDRSWRITDK